jgi:hypothetical protein
MADTNIKPGWQSTEFWLAVASLLVSLVAAGFGWDAATQHDVQTAVASATTSLVSVVSSVTLAWKYMHGRETLKSIDLMSRAQQGEHEEDEEEEKHDEPPPKYGFAPKSLVPGHDGFDYVEEED